MTRLILYIPGGKGKERKVKESKGKERKMAIDLLINAWLCIRVFHTPRNKPWVPYRNLKIDWQLEQKSPKTRPYSCD